MKRQSQRYLGFFALFALFALPGLLEGEWGQAVWLVWLVWLVFFFKKEDGKGNVNDEPSKSETDESHR